MEALLRQGYHPQGATGGIASATKELERREGINYPRWVRDEERSESAGRPHYAVDWSVYQPPLLPPSAPDEIPAEVTLTSDDHAAARARSLAAEITGLVTGSRYPLINPDAVVVEAYQTRRYSRRAQAYEMVEGTPRTWLTDTLRVAPVLDARNRRYLFTAAQNDAPVHEGFWANLEAYAGYLGAEIVVGPFTYETSWWNESCPIARRYDPLVEDHLCFGQMAIGDTFVFAGEVNIIPTAASPISDLTTYSRSRWAVFPHGKRQLKSVPSTDPNIQSHQAMTTGCVTRPKVIPRKAGTKSIFHHVIGAVLVEFDEAGRVFCRQLTADDDGAFYDLDRHVRGGEVSEGHRVRALVCADIHLRKLDPANAMATFGFDLRRPGLTYRDNIVDHLKPDYVLLHDLFDNESRNHHHVGDSAYHYEMAVRGRDRVLDEVVEVGQFLERVASPDREIVVVQSNHDNGLERWVREGRYRCDGVNTRFGLQLEDAYLGHRHRAGEALDRGMAPPSFSMLEHAVRLTQARLEGVRWAYDGGSFLIDGIEVGHHGFRGVNGARGTVQGFSRVGRKMSIGDKHQPEILEGVYVAGSMNLRMGYNLGPSGWATSHILQYRDGSRSLVTLQEGKWRGDKPRISMKADKCECQIMTRAYE